MFKKLPISLDVLQTLKGVGSDVATLSRSDAFDEGERFQHSYFEYEIFGGKLLSVLRQMVYLVSWSVPSVL